MENEKCEHELNCVDEHWMGESSVQVTMQCQKCEKKFSGVLFLK
jgi:hypothetical protein